MEEELGLEGLDLEQEDGAATSVAAEDGEWPGAGGRRRPGAGAMMAVQLRLELGDARCNKYIGTKLVPVGISNRD